MQAQDAVDTAGFEHLSDILAVLEMREHKNPVTLDLITAVRSGIYDAILEKKEEKTWQEKPGPNTKSG